MKIQRKKRLSVSGETDNAKAEDASNMPKGGSQRRKSAPDTNTCAAKARHLSTNEMDFGDDDDFADDMSRWAQQLPKTNSVDDEPESESKSPQRGEVQQMKDAVIWV